MEMFLNNLIEFSSIKIETLKQESCKIFSLLTDKICFNILTVNFQVKIMFIVNTHWEGGGGAHINIALS